jgi:hypothetical protein
MYTDADQSCQPKLMDTLTGSVADPGCLSPRSRILIFTHPGFWISDPGFWIQKQQQKRGVKKNLMSYFLCSDKIVHYFSFEVLKKNFLAIFKEL